MKSQRKACMTERQKNEGEKEGKALIDLCSVCEGSAWLSALLERCKLAIMLTIKGED